MLAITLAKGTINEAGCRCKPRLEEHHAREGRPPRRSTDTRSRGRLQRPSTTPWPTRPVAIAFSERAPTPYSRPAATDSATASRRPLRAGRAPRVPSHPSRNGQHDDASRP